MRKLRNISENEAETISKQIADAFYDYKYNDEDEGLIKYIRTREDMYTYIGAIVKAAYKLWVGHSKFRIIPGMEDTAYVQTWGRY